jgi:hypothetical protein
MIQPTCKVYTGVHIFEPFLRSKHQICVLLTHTTTWCRLGMAVWEDLVPKTNNYSSKDPTMLYDSI